MTTHNARIAVLPRELASEVVTGGLSLGGWAVSIGILAMNVLVIIETVGRRSGAAATVVPLACTAGLLCLLVLMRYRPTLLTRILFLMVGVALGIIFQVGVLTVDPSLNESASYLLNRPALILVIGIPGLVRPLAALGWGVAGYAAAMASVMIADLVARVPVVFGWGPTITLAVYASAYLTVAGVRATRAFQPTDLARLEDDTRRLALEHQFEQRAAAIIHDTVLSDLTAIMQTSGPLDDRARTRFRADVALLSDPAWLRESRDQVMVDPQGAALRNGLTAIISEVQWRGLSVDITGGHEVERVRLDPASIIAVLAAVRACLENVLQHAQTASAQIVVGVSGRLVTVMIIDQGVGFDTAAIASDRLGLRTSIRRRIDELGGVVKVWSTPGHGTSIMLTLPCELLEPGKDSHVE